MTEEPMIYVASRASIPERANTWRFWRNMGVPINSSWIDEAGPGETASHEYLWLRCLREISEADALVLYAKAEDFPLKGALVEAGAALALNKPVIVCLPGVDLEDRSYRPIGSWIRHPLVCRVDQLGEAIDAASIAARLLPRPARAIAPKDAAPPPPPSDELVRLYNEGWTLTQDQERLAEALGGDAIEKRRERP